MDRLREAGAIILGKTVTTELAAFTPGKTRNPHDPKRTPGGSSSGSAAAVGASMVPLAVGSQTNGSVIRPASFCGVVGFKPSRGLISRRGMLSQSETLDTVGVFARTIEDAALIVDALAGYDDRDPQTILAAAPQLLATAKSRPPVKPSFALVRSPVWEKAEDDVREGFRELAEALGDRIVEIELPEPFPEAHAWHRAINMAEMARNYARYYDRDPALLSDRLRGMIEEGLAVRAVDYLRALDGIAMLNAGLEKLFERYDAIVTPAAPGEAPVGEATGDPGLQHALDLLRRAGRDAAASHRLERHADRRAARRATALRRTAAAHRRVAFAEAARRGAERRRGDGRRGMRLLDRVFATLAFLAFAGFLGILIWFVPKPGLILVCVVCAGALRLRLRAQHLYPALAGAELSPRGRALTSPLRRGSSVQLLRLRQFSRTDNPWLKKSAGASSRRR